MRPVTMNATLAGAVVVVVLLVLAVGAVAVVAVASDEVADVAKGEEDWSLNMDIGIGIF